MSTNILTISPDSALESRIKKLFLDGSSQVVQVSREARIDRLSEFSEPVPYDVMILTSAVCKDANGEGIRRLEGLIAKSPMTKVLFLVEPEDIQIAKSALEAGTYQYAKLPVSDTELRMLIEAALASRQQNGTSKLLPKDESRNRFEPFIGRSPAMRQVYRQIRKAATTDIPLMILGETGTGKDLAAQAIHQRSRRSKGPYIPVNLGALPSELVASELFGHEKGTFTGALKQHRGKFEQGNDGTVFLDEIDCIDEKVQVSLLRLIEQKEFHRLGGEQAVKSNARLIVASNQNLEALVRAGSFRQDLFFRLDIFRIVMPPLRQRQGDIPLLVENFLAHYRQAFDKRFLEIGPECMQLLEAYDWPGNVRELKNVIQRAVLVCEGKEILPEHFPVRFRSVETPQPTATFEIGTPLEVVEREMVIRALSEANNNRTRAAELLGISRRAIYNKLRKHNLHETLHSKPTE